MELSWSSLTWGLAVAFGTFFMLANPAEALPAFLHITAKCTPEERARIARRACTFAGAIMLASFLLGDGLLRVVKVSLPAVLVAGGLVVIVLGFTMLLTGKLSFHTDHAAEEGRDQSLIPLGFPGVCGPGVIAALISASPVIRTLETTSMQVAGYLVVCAAIILVCLAAWTILRMSGAIERRLGPDGIEAMCRLMGLLLILIGVQCVANGVTGFIAAPKDATPAGPLPVTASPAE